MNNTVNTENIFGKDGFVWWIGVVEDRKEDPDKLGRVRVRIMGYHSDDLEILPTEELPWAITMQPTTSAAVSGIGSSPTNLVEGSWVIGFFLDSKEKQQPIVIGTIGGFTQRVPFCGQESTYETVVVEGALLTQDGTIVTDSSGAPILSEPTTIPPSEGVGATPGGGIAPTGPASSPAGAAVRTDLPPLTRDQIQALMDSLGQRESSNNYQADNRLGFVGRYQFGSAALEDQGLIRRGATAAEGPRAIYNSANWTNPAAPSLQSFLDNTALQDQVMFNNLSSNYNNLRGGTGRTAVISPSTDSPERVGGLLAAAHLGGAGGARRLALEGSTSTDAFGTSTRNYYDLGFTAVATAGTPGGIAAAVAASRAGIPATIPRASLVPGGRLAAAYSSPEATAFRAAVPSEVGGFSDWSEVNEIILSSTDAFQDPNQEFPRCDYVDKPDTNKLATGDVLEGDTIYSRKLDTRREGIEVARGVATWDEPAPAYCAEYPYNQVFETEAGHVIELDNTPGFERIHVYHKEGTYIEIDVNGTSVRKVVGDNYELIENNNYLFCKGAYNLTIEGATKVLIKNNVDLEVHGDANVDLHKNLNLNVAEDFNLSVGGNFNIDVKEAIGIKHGAKFSVRGGSSFDMRNAGTNIDGGQIHLNSGRANPEVEDLGHIDEREPGPTPDDNIRPDCILEDPLYEEVEEEDFFTEGVEAGEITITAIEAEAEVYGVNTPIFEIADVEDGTGAISGGDFAGFVDLGVDVPATEFPVTDLISITTFPPGIRLSDNFTLGALMPDITSRAATAGVPPQSILTNLRNLSANSLDAISNRFPDLNIITGDIPSLNRAMSFSRNLGQAAVMQFLSTAPADYVNIAGWIRQNVPYSQLLLQYRTSTTTSALIPSIAVALGSTVNIPIVGTTLNGSVVAPFLSNLI